MTVCFLMISPMRYSGRMYINQYEIVLVTIVIAPMATPALTYPTRVKVRHHRRYGWIVVDRIMTTDRKRILKRLGKITYPEIRKRKEVIRETYVDRAGFP